MLVFIRSCIIIIPCYYLSIPFMAPSSSLLLFLAVSVIGTIANAAIVEHTFNVANFTVNRLCQKSIVTAVNGQLPGPTINVREGDTLVVHVLNNSPYNVTIHWHGVFQLMSAWADGPSYVTQCPIVPKTSYTYKFTIVGQEGTLWWHAHSSTIRATVYGALIIRPRKGVNGYPFAKPYQAVPILLGEWWKANIVDLDFFAYTNGLAINISDAFTINGSPGDQYPCSKKDTFKLKVKPGKTYLLQIINTGLNSELFFKVAGHSLTVVGADASYTVTYSTEVIIVGPGQTVDALMTANASPGNYYMAASAYVGGVIAPFYDNTTTTGIVEYENYLSNRVPVMPVMPPVNDTPTANMFFTSLTALLRPGMPTVPLKIDEHMFMTFGLGLVPCGLERPKCQFAFSGSMNNISFQFPTASARMSLLEGKFKGVNGLYTTDFPDVPPQIFDFTNLAQSGNSSLFAMDSGTKVKRLKYNTTVEVVLQNTVVLSLESHPIHLHGYNFFIVAQGFGNYDATSSVKGYNLVNPQERNTVSVPAGGWAVIRFRANNPGVWLMHCHLDNHMSIGLGMAFAVDNGPTKATSLPPPPQDLPHC